MATSAPVAITHWKPDPDFEIRQKPLDWGLIVRLYEQTHSFSKLRGWLFVLTIARAIQLPALAWCLGAIINGPIAAGDWGFTVQAAFGFLLLAAFTQITFHFRMRLALFFGELVADHLRQSLFAHLQTLPMDFYNKTKLGQIISRMTGDVENVRLGVQDVLFVSTVGIGQMLVSFCIMLWIDWNLAMIVALLAPILWGINRYFRARLSDAYRNVQESYSRLTSTLAESVNGIRVTQGFVRERVNSGVFSDLALSHAANNRVAAHTAGILLPSLEFNSHLFTAALLLIGGYRVLHPEIQMPVGNLIFFFFLANVFFNPIQILGNQYNQALTSMASAERVFKLLDTKPSWVDAPEAQPAPKIEGLIEFREVTFGYDPNTPVLKNISFQAQPGQTFALVGATGSGKTSMINLIAKFYLPQSGEILVDGHNTRNLQTSTLRRQMGIVLQTNYLFTGTIRANIRFGKPDATNADIDAVVKSLDFWDVVQGLPDGMETEVGERGTSLSLGQRQLICFARALIADPRILILDEATSSIDTITEMKIQRALNLLLAGRTSFVIAHRLSTIRHADMVLVLDHGEIIERGTHNQLRQAGGKYQQLYDQFTRASEIG